MVLASICKSFDPEESQRPRCRMSLALCLRACARFWLPRSSGAVLAEVTAISRSMEIPNKQQEWMVRGRVITKTRKGGAHTDFNPVLDNLHDQR